MARGLCCHVVSLDESWGAHQYAAVSDPRRHIWRGRELFFATSDGGGSAAGRNFAAERLEDRRAPDLLGSIGRAGRQEREWVSGNG
jgi:hypothetical protein